jgi:hypothetical protein
MPNARRVPHVTEKGYIRFRNIAKSDQPLSRKSKQESRLPAKGLGRYPT